MTPWKGRQCSAQRRMQTSRKAGEKLDWSCAPMTPPEHAPAVPRTRLEDAVMVCFYYTNPSSPILHFPPPSATEGTERQELKVTMAEDELFTCRKSWASEKSVQILSPPEAEAEEREGNAQTVLEVKGKRGAVPGGTMRSEVRSVGGLWLCLLLLCTDASGQTCTKFSSKSDMVPFLLNGTCYYGHTVHIGWNSAFIFCASETTHLVHLQTVEKQLAVYNILGNNFNQYWVGIRRLNGTWWWWFNDTNKVNATADVHGRFNSDGGQNVAITTGGNTMTLMTAGLDWTNPLVCEDSFPGGQDTTKAEPTTAPTTTTTITEPTTATTVTEPTTTITTTEPTAAITTPEPTPTTQETTTVNQLPEYSAQINSALFYKQTALTTAKYLKNVTSASRVACAVHCLLFSGCHHIGFSPWALKCLLYEDSAGSVTIDPPTCGAERECFSIMVKA